MKTLKIYLQFTGVFAFLLLINLTAISQSMCPLDGDGAEEELELISGTS